MLIVGSNTVLIENLFDVSLMIDMQISQLELKLTLLLIESYQILTNEGLDIDLHIVCCNGIVIIAYGKRWNVPA